MRTAQETSSVLMLLSVDIDMPDSLDADVKCNNMMIVGLPTIF